VLIAWNIQLGNVLAKFNIYLFF